MLGYTIKEVLNLRTWDWEVETTDTGYLIIDDAGRVIDAYSEYARLSGHRTLDEIIGRSVIDWTAPYELERAAKEWKKCIKKGYRIIRHVVSKSEIRIPRMFSFFLQPGGGEELIDSDA